MSVSLSRSPFAHRFAAEAAGCNRATRRLFKTAKPSSRGIFEKQDQDFIKNCAAVLCFKRNCAVQGESFTRALKVIKRVAPTIELPLKMMVSETSECQIKKAYPNLKHPNNNLTSETSLSSPITLYHGTSSRYADTILKNGLLPKDKTGNSNWQGNISSHDQLVYLSNCYPVVYASHCADTVGGDLVVFKVAINFSDAYPDEDYIAQARWYRTFFRRFLKPAYFNPTANPLAYKNLAFESLKNCGTLAVHRVSPEQILGHRIIRSNQHALKAFLGIDAVIMPIHQIPFGKHLADRIDLLFKYGASQLNQAVMDWFIPQWLVPALRQP